MGLFIMNKISLRIAFCFFVLTTTRVLISATENVVITLNKTTHLEKTHSNIKHIVIKCPIRHAVWILPYQLFFKEEIMSAKSGNNSSEITLDVKNRNVLVSSWGTYSCCSQEHLPLLYRKRQIYFRDMISCIDGCCPSIRNGCAIDIAERKCLQAHVVPSEGYTSWLPGFLIEKSDVLLPCIASRDSVLISARKAAPYMNGTYIPGHGYCLNSEYIQERALVCEFEDEETSRVLFNNHRIRKLKKAFLRPMITFKFGKLTRKDPPDNVNIVYGSNITVTCKNYTHYYHRSHENIDPCFKWDGFSCFSCPLNHQSISLNLLDLKERKSRRISCVARFASSRPEISKEFRSSFTLNITKQPYIVTDLNKTSEKVIKQYSKDPLIKVKIQVSPQTGKVVLRATNNDTGAVIAGECDEWNTFCTISLHRSEMNVTYKLEFKLQYGENFKMEIQEIRWVKLVTHYNKEPAVVGLSKIGLFGKDYAVVCRQNAFPRGKVDWIITDNLNESYVSANWTTIHRQVRDTLFITNLTERHICLKCAVSSVINTMTSKVQCMTTSDVDMQEYDCRLNITSQNPLSDLGNSDNGRISQFVSGAILNVRCATHHKPIASEESIKLLLNSKVVEDVSTRWNGYSFQVNTTLNLSDVSLNGSEFSCLAPNEWKTSNPIKIQIRLREPPMIVHLPSNRRALDMDELRQECIATGVPLPWVYWSFKGRNVSKPGHGKSQLHLVNMTRLQSGAYTCVARANNDVIHATLHIDINPVVYGYKVLIIVLVIVLFVIIICSVTTAFLFVKNRRLRRKLFNRYSLFLRNGDGENNYTNQFDLCQWQLPPQNLRLTREKLGQGEFGRVLKGLLQKTDSYGGDLHPVAVKQLLSDSFILGMGRSPEEESVSRRKFMEEIQIMSQVGKHDNVLQMLGVVVDENTLQISLVCEFCEGGNLVNYLQCRQANFIMRLSNGESDSEQSLTFKDLLRIAHDIARGMTHIHSQGVLHRDLAARNVLIGSNKSAKISDFGLSRNRGDYAGLEYSRRNTNEKLPWKWLALECLREGLFSAKSDVWSYGITLWEVFSLGNKPYPEQYYTNYFIRNLNSGYRLSRPVHASDSVFEVMKSCWLTEPDLRPSFSQIATTFQSLVERWNSEGAHENGVYGGGKRSLSSTNGRAMNIQYINVVGSPPNDHAECEIKLMEAYVPMSEGSAYTTYSHVF